MKEECSMVRHIVSWNFKPELTDEQRQAVRKEIVPRINALKDLVPCALDVKARFARLWTAATAIWSSTLRSLRLMTCRSIRTTRSTRLCCP